MLDDREWVVLNSTKVLTAGTKRPLLSTMMSNGGGRSVAQFAIKPEGDNMTAAQVCAEALCSSLAAAAGIPTPLAIVITLDAEAAEQLSRDSRVVRPGIAFASRYVDGAVAFKRAPASYHIEALRIYLFDYVVQNRDRLSLNPNLIYARDELIAIDHEQCFDFCCRGGDIDAPGPFLSSAAMDMHVFKDIVAREAVTLQAGGIGKLLDRLLNSVGPSVVDEVQRYCGLRAHAPFDWDMARERIRDVKQNVELHATAIVNQLS